MWSVTSSSVNPSAVSACAHGAHLYDRAIKYPTVSASKLARLNPSALLLARMFIIWGAQYAHVKQSTSALTEDLRIRVLCVTSNIPRRCCLLVREHRSQMHKMLMCSLPEEPLASLIQRPPHTREPCSSTIPGSHLADSHRWRCSHSFESPS